jgi:predicted HTH transcriptional regulator
LRDNVGEANELDFKREWPETSKLARHVLGLANFGGGCMVIGVEQVKESALNPVGLSARTDKTEVLSGLNKYLPDTLGQQVAILDFPYEESEYPKLKGKSFQVLFVEDDPVHLPFVAIRGVQTSEPTRYIRGAESLLRRRPTMSYSGFLVGDWRPDTPLAANSI